MSDHLQSARAKLEKGDFAGMSPAELQALATWSAKEPKGPGTPRMLPALIEQVLDICQPEDRASCRDKIAALFKDRVHVVIEKTWGDDDFKTVRMGQ